MQHIEVMDSKQFAGLLSEMKTDDVIDFGVDGGCAYPDEVPECGDVTGWYFAQKMYIEQYDSSFIILDYAGGGQAFCIPLDYDTSKKDMELFSMAFFKHIECMSGEMTNVLFVEIND